MTNTLLIAFGSMLMAIAGLLPSSRSIAIYKRSNIWITLLGGILVTIGSINSKNEQAKFETTIADKTQIIHDLSKKLEKYSD